MMQNTKPIIIEDPLMTLVKNDAGVSFQPSQFLTDLFGKTLMAPAFHPAPRPSGKNSNKVVQNGKQK